MRVLFVIDELHQEPLGIGYLAGALKENGHQGRCHFFGSYKALSQEITHYQPEIVAFSVMTGWEKFYINIAQWVKTNFRTYVIFGGPHPTFSPETLEEYPLDAICIGEGEAAIVDLANRLDQGQSLADIREIPGIWIKTNGTISRNPVAPLIEDLDQLAFPDRSIFYCYKQLGSSGLKTFLAGRGCPYQCSYCFNHAFNNIYKGKGRPLRYRSVNNLLEEIHQVKDRYPLSLVRFTDDIFIVQEEWLGEFAESYRRKIGLPFFCGLRADLVTKNRIRLLKMAGCYSIGLGIETANEQLRAQVLNRKMTNQQILDACHLIKRYGIKLNTASIVGIPGSTIEDELETIKLNIECGVDYAWASIMHPYPKTAIYQITRQMGIEIDPPDKMERHYLLRTPLQLPNRHEIDNLHKLLPLIVEFPWLIRFFRRLIQTKSKSLFQLYTLVFGIFELYCVEFRIFRHSSLMGLIHPQRFYRLIKLSFIGIKKMQPFSKENTCHRKTETLR